ncbi:MAG: molybdopterin-synthase adenylyltransferase MoeB [Alphaproteobacteria bacterium]|nr:molybdopterin-synthase adenylyltransferase MoeB [Alphaproteobacteria bacterium]
MTPGERERYLRHLLLKEVGGQGQQKLKNARVLIVGAGGLGAPMIQYLAGAGVGTIGLADDDSVALSNLQRQVIYATGDIGAPKTERAKAFAQRLNPEIDVIEHRVRLDNANAREIVERYDLVAEGVDSFEARYAINRAAIAARRPLVSAAVGRFEGQLSLFKPFAGAGLPCYRCFAPAPPPREEAIDCEREGVFGPVVGVVGALAALEILKEILGVGESLAGRILLYDSLRSMARLAKLPADPACPDCGSIDRESR